MTSTRVRRAIRRLIVAAAFVAVGLGLVYQFWEGTPPRFVLRGVPERFGRLRPGMTREQVREILGLERSWISGGTSARPKQGFANDEYTYEIYELRPPKLVNLDPRARPPFKPEVWRATAEIHLKFRRNPDVVRDPEPWQVDDQARDDSDQLEWASFTEDGGPAIQVPGSL